MNVLSSDQVAEMERMLTAHYGEPVRPVSAYCNAFRTWRDAIAKKLARIAAGDEDDYLAGEWRRVLDALNMLELPIIKSNLLHRLIYVGEGLRQEPCPIHKGRWSGCAMVTDDCSHCMSGNNVTGWVTPAPEHFDSSEED